MKNTPRLGADPLDWIAPSPAPAPAAPAPSPAPGGARLLEGLETRREGKEAKAKLEQRMAAAQALDYLEAVLAGLRSGRLRLGRGQEALGLALAGQVDLEIKAGVKKGRAKCALSLEWETD
jgi:amphi-Trp domain-containing protein